MTLLVEDGSCVQGAESYASAAYIKTYWTNRPQNAFSAQMLAATDANIEGAAREASGFIDATWGPFYKGKRRGYVQGLLWPRTDALDEQGYPLPDLPVELMIAVAELAARAVSTSLAQDLDRGGMVKMLKAGSVEIEYADGAPGQTTYGVLALTLAPILNGSQPNAPNPLWAWS